MDSTKRNHLLNLGSYYSTIIYGIAATTKISFGLYFHSSALYTDGLNSISDILSTIIIIIGLHLSRKPQDDDHTYGHYRIEQIATLLASLIMFIIGGQSLLQGIQKVRMTNLEAPDITSAYVALLSIVLITSSAIFNSYIAKKTNADSAQVIAKNNMSDSLTAFGALVAIVAAQFNIPIIDPIVSLLIAGVIIKTAFDIFMSSSNSLIDGFDKEALIKYRMLILKHPGVKQVTDIRGRMLSNIAVIDITITVDGNISVYQGHKIADEIETMLHLKYNIAHTHVHIEPEI